MNRVKFTDKYPGQEVRALSWKQPYASLMLHGKIETRVWDTGYRGWVLICASKSAYDFKDIMAISGRNQIERIKDKLNLFEWYEKGGVSLKYIKDPIPQGQAIAVGYLKYSRKMGELAADRCITDTGLWIEDQSFVKMNYKLYLHEYSQVQAIEPFDWKGSQGWKTLDEETKNKIILL